MSTCNKLVDIIKYLRNGDTVIFHLSGSERKRFKINRGGITKRKAKINRRKIYINLVFTPDYLKKIKWVLTVIGASKIDLDDSEIVASKLCFLFLRIMYHI